MHELLSSSERKQDMTVLLTSPQNKVPIIKCMISADPQAVLKINHLQKSTILPYIQQMSVASVSFDNEY